jgi:hypothetical protein
MKLSPIRKNGAMTVPKLVAIILAIVILIFLVFGATHLQPLYKRMGVMFDNVLYFFGLEEDGRVRGECTPLRILDWTPEGGEFLNAIGIATADQGNYFLDVCDDGSCGINLTSGGHYRISENRFEYSIGGDNWGPLNKLLSGDAEVTKNYWEIYQATSMITDDSGKNLQEIYGKILLGDPFVLFGRAEGSSKDRDIYAYWQAGEWTLLEEFKENDVYKYLEGSQVMIIPGKIVMRIIPVVKGNELDYFIKAVKDETNQDEVYFFSGNYADLSPYSKGDSSWRTINELVGNDNTNNELDSDAEVLILKNKISALALEWEFGPVDKPLSAKKYFSGDLKPVNVIVEDEEFEVTEDLDSSVILTSGEVRYRFTPSYSGRTGMEALKLFYDSVPEAYYAVVRLQEWNGNKWIEIDEGRYNYYLPEDIFGEYYKNTLIKEFIREKCR